MNARPERGIAKNHQRQSCCLIAVVALCFVSGSCRRAEAQSAMRNWVNNMSQLGIIAIYPPREDVQVGDVYVFPYDPTGDLEKENIAPRP